MKSPLKHNFDKNNNLYAKTEKIYKTYHEVSDDRDQLLSFYKTLDADYVFKHILYIPGYTPAPPAHITEDSGFLRPEINVGTRKHACYLPVFLHDHTFYEIIYVAEGSCKNVINGKTIEMKKGDLFFIPPNVTHSIEAYTPGIIINVLARKTFMENIFILLNFNKNTLYDFICSSLFDNSINTGLLCRTEEDAFCYNVLELLFAESQSDAIDSINISLRENLFISFLLYIAEHFDHTSTIIQSSGIVSMDKVLPNILVFIRNHYKTVTLNDLSASFHYSTDHISKLIKANTGKNFVDIRTEYRMEAAQNLLSNTSLPIKKISEAVGYNKAEQFNKAFKNMFNITPSAYRATTSS